MLLGVGLVSATGLMHFLGLVPIVRRIRATNKRPLARDMAVLVAVVVAHCAEAGVYAGGFALGHGLELGAFAQVEAMGWMDYFYFSLVNYNTLGLGDIHPTGHLRFIAGVEALNGFLLISCSASILFDLMRQETSDSRASDRPAKTQ
jgi:hypothetical protein